MPVLLLTGQVTWMMPDERCYHAHFQCPSPLQGGEWPYSYWPIAKYFCCVHVLYHTPILGLSYWLRDLPSGEMFVLCFFIIPFSNGTKQGCKLGWVSLRCWSIEHTLIFFIGLALVRLGKGITAIPAGPWHLRTLCLLAFSCYPKPILSSNGLVDGEIEVEFHWAFAFSLCSAVRTFSCKTNRRNI